LLCHAPSLSREQDIVRGAVPIPGRPLPPPVSTQYYDANTGPFVRAEVTYLQQDFSVPQPVAKPDKWPAYQRYDYLVRERPVYSQDIAKAGASTGHTDAVLYALRELTGKDFGAKTVEWRKLVGKGEVPQDKQVEEDEATVLRTQLVEAPQEKFADVLKT